MTKAALLYVALCLAARPSEANDDASPSVSKTPTAADLVRAVQASEQWVHEVDGLRLVVKTLADAGNDEGAEAVETERFEWVFGRDRFRFEVSSKQSSQILVWNGEEARSVSRSDNNSRVYYAIDDEPYELLHDYPFVYLSWLRAAVHPVWWRNPAMIEGSLKSWPQPEDFELVGKHLFKGVSCHTVRYEVPGNVTTWFIGESDGLLRGTRVEFRTGEVREMWTVDYREIAPGCWVPFEQGYAGYELDSDGKSVRQYGADRRVVNAEVGLDLTSISFDLPFEEGVQTTDYRFGPAIYYEYVEKLPDDKLNELLKEAREQEAETEAYNKRREAFVGRPAAPFPKGHWINSQPLDWEKLKGKPVVLEFWATSCGPCRSDFPELNKAHENSKRTGVVIIGVHDAMPKEHFANVESFVKEHKLQYPIFVEDLPEGRERHPMFGSGMLNQYYEVRGIPHSIVVDAEGKIASWGLWAPNAISHAVWLAATKNQEDGKK